MSLARARQAFRDIEFHPDDPARRLRGRHRARRARAARRAAVRHRADRVHPDDADRGRDRGRVRGGRGRDPVLAVDDGHDVDRGRRGGKPGRAQLVSAVHVEGPRPRRWRWSSGPRRPGFDTLLVTVDVPVAGARLRDIRNGMTIPPTLTPRTVLDAIPRPRWWFNLLTTEPLTFAVAGPWSGTVAELLDTMFDPTRDLRRPGVDQGRSGRASSWSRACRPSTTPAGASSSASTRSCCPTTAAASSTARRCRSTCCPGRAGGRRRHRDSPRHRHHVRCGHRGGDRARRPVHAGRPRLPVRADGRRRAGVDRAIEILSAQVSRTMRLLGVTSLDELTPRHVTQLHRFRPDSA